VSVVRNSTESIHTPLHNTRPSGLVAKITDVKQETLGQSQDALAGTIYTSTVLHQTPEARKPLRNWERTEEKHLGTVRIHLRALEVV